MAKTATININGTPTSVTIDSVHVNGLLAQIVYVDGSGNLSVLNLGLLPNQPGPTIIGTSASGF